MADNTFKEITIPMLPSCSMAETLTFYQALGFQITYQQKRPNTYAVVKLRGIELHFFVMKGFKPTDNYGTCYIMVEGIDELYQAFTHGIRECLGKLPIRGIPRVNPLKNIPAYGVRQFIVVDPSGNYIRIGQTIPKTKSLVYPEDEKDSRFSGSPLERALEIGTRLADAKGDFDTAASVLDKALAEDKESEWLVRLRALILRADLAVRQEEPALSKRLLEEAEKIITTFADHSQVQEELRLMDELRTFLD